MGSLWRSLSPAVLTVFLVLASSCTAQNSPQDFLTAHNSARKEVGVGPLAWDNSLAAYAQDYANKRIDDCNLYRSDGPYGENLFWGKGREFTATDAVRSWVSEKQYYHYNSNTCDPRKICGHYTQVVWRNTKRVGCARVQCNSGAFYFVCSYDPPGNWRGQRPYSMSI